MTEKRRSAAQVLGGILIAQPQLVYDPSRAADLAWEMASHLEALEIAEEEEFTQLAHPESDHED